MNHELHFVTQRLERLERQNRLLKIGGLVVLLLGVILACAGSGRSSTSLDVQTLTLRDSRGVARGVLGIQESGAAFLSLRDEDEVPRILLSVGQKRSPILTLSDGTGVPRVTLSADPEGMRGPLLSLWGKNGQIRAALVAVEDGASALVLADQNGDNNALLSADENGSPALVFHNAEKVLWQAP